MKSKLPGVLILVVRPKALVVSVIQPFLFPSIRQSQQFASQIVPVPPLFRKIATSLDCIAAFQSVDSESHSRELYDVGTLNGPELGVSVLILYIDIKKAVRIDSLKPNDCSLQCDARRGVETGSANDAPPASSPTRARTELPTVLLSFSAFAYAS